MHFLFLGLDTTLRFPIKELFIVEAIHSFDPEASSPSLDKNLLSLYVGERVVILGNFDFLKKKSQVVCLLSLQLHNLRSTCAQLFSFMKVSRL